MRSARLTIIQNWISNRSSDKNPLYRKLLKPYLPDDSEIMPEVIWNIIAEYCFFLAGLRCRLSGRILINPILVNGRGRWPIVYAGEFLKKVAQSQKTENFHDLLRFDYRVRIIEAEKLTAVIEKLYLNKVRIIRKLTKFALNPAHYKIPIGKDVTDTKIRQFLNMIEKDNSINLIIALKLAINKKRLSGSTEFDLADFLNRYDLPIMRDVKSNYEFDTSNSASFFAAMLYGFLIIYFTLVLGPWMHPQTAEDYLFSKFLKDRISSAADLISLPFVFALQLGCLGWYAHLTLSIDDQFTNRYFAVKDVYYRLKSIKLALPASLASEILKWSVFSYNLFENYYSPSLLIFKMFYISLETFLLLSNVTDITCRKTIEDCKSILRGPQQLLMKPAMNKFGFFKKPAPLAPQKKVLQFSYALWSALLIYLATKNPFYALMTLISAFQFSALPDALYVKEVFSLVPNNAALKDKQDDKVSPHAVMIVPRMAW